MKKVLIIVFSGILLLPQFYITTWAHIDKTHGSVTGAGGKNIHKSDSVWLSFDPFTSTISINTVSGCKAVDVHIYKEGALIYKDKDNVGKDFSLNYTMDDEESGMYDVCVDIDGGESIEGTIVKE